MQKKSVLIVLAATLGLAACGETDLERGVTGAAIGGVGAELTGGSALTGALIGGAAGVLCDDVSPELCG